MNKYIKGFAISLVCALSVQCNDWLNVNPKGNIEAEEMLSTEKGYNAAIGGVYYTLSNSSLYAKDLSYGMMDILAQYWDISTKTSHTYYKLFTYDYTDASSVSRFNAIWGYMYQGIFQCNKILSSLEENRTTIKHSELFEGEAYGLRAFMHMELFRMFGPVIHTTADLSKKSIPYMTEFSVVTNEFLSGQEILDKVEADLLKALDLLQNDPIKVKGRRGDANTELLGYSDILYYRGARMNYYGVLGLLCRLKQLEKKNDEALVYAKRIINETSQTGVLGLIDKANIEASTDSWKDVNYSGEMLSSIYVNNLYSDYTHPFFYMGGASSSSNSSIFITTAEYTTLLNDVYGRTPDGSGTDNRLRYWFTTQTTSGTTQYYDFLKLKQVTISSGISAAYNPEIPIMRMSEVYYIACESSIGVDNAAALEYLNAVRRTRNLADIALPVTDDELREYLLRDERKDFIGEGQMFYVYKRLFTNIYVKAGTEISPLESMFVFPIPDNEYEYSQNQKPA